MSVVRALRSAGQVDDHRTSTASLVLRLSSVMTGTAPGASPMDLHDSASTGPQHPVRYASTPWARVEALGSSHPPQPDADSPGGLHERRGQGRVRANLQNDGRQRLSRQQRLAGLIDQSTGATSKRSQPHQPRSAHGNR